MLILIIIMLITLTTVAVSLAFSTTQDTTTHTLGERALTIAESGAENAILRLIRDPSYTGDSNFAIGPGAANISVSGTMPYIITSVGTVGNMVRTVQVEVDSVSGQLSVISWQEI